MQKKKPTDIKQLLFFGDYNCDTGFGHVSRELIKHWAKDKSLKITIFAINDFSEEPYQPAENILVMPALSTSETKKDVYCRIEFLSILHKYDYDVVFCLNDVEVFNEMEKDLRIVRAAKLKANRKNFKSILYFPIDSEPRPTDLKILSFFDEVITYTEYAKGAIKPLVKPELFKKVKVIPHGCDTTNFYPFSPDEKLQAKKEIFGRDDVFVFGSVNRNSVRKDLATLLIGFAFYKISSQQDSILYLHCNPTDHSGVNIPNLCVRLGLDFGKDVIVPEAYTENKGYTTEQLNKIYNSFDCFITTTTAEGWGLTITEAMATKTLVVCPKHTSITEITDNGANTLNFMMQQHMVFPNDAEKIRFVSNPNEVAQLFSVVYGLQSEGEATRLAIAQKIQDAYDKVKGMKWEFVADRFKVVIDRLCK